MISDAERLTWTCEETADGRVKWPEDVAKNLLTDELLRQLAHVQAGIYRMHNPPDDPNVATLTAFALREAIRLIESHRPGAERRKAELVDVACLKSYMQAEVRALQAEEACHAAEDEVAKLLRRHRAIRDRKLREAIKKRDRGLCRYCGEPGNQLDHYEPDGPATLENLVLACRDCNIRKGNTRPKHLRKLKSMVLRPVPRG